MVSSRRVHMSMIRISSVGKRTLGRISHHIFVPSSISPALTSTSRWRWNSAKLSNRSGRPVRGSSFQTARRYDLRPVLIPCQNGDDVLSASRCGRK